MKTRSRASRAHIPTIALLVICVLAVLSPAVAGPHVDLSRSSREATQGNDPYVTEVNYTGFTTSTITPYPAVFSQELFSREAVGSALAAPRDRDDRAKVTVSDVSGRPTAGWVYFIKPGQDSYTTRLICPSTKKALPIDPHYAIVVSLAVGECGGDTSLPTRGKITFTFSGQH